MPAINFLKVSEIKRDLNYLKLNRKMNFLFSRMRLQCRGTGKKTGWEFFRNTPTVGYIILILDGVLHLLIVGAMYGFGSVILAGCGPMILLGPTSIAISPTLGSIFLFGKTGLQSSLTTCMGHSCI